MATKTERELRIEELRALLEKASDAYYNSDKKIMDDFKFDELKEEYEILTMSDFPVGAPTNSKNSVEIAHTFKNLVGTLGKTNTIDDVREWFERLSNQIKLPKIIQILVTYKYDGNSIAGEFKDGILIKALTRGRDGKGADRTHMFRNRKIKYKGHVGVRYEAMLTYENFKTVLKLKQAEDPSVTYVNPRSLLAGLLSDENGDKYADYIDLVALSIQSSDEHITREEELEILEEQVGYTNIPLEGQIIEGTIEEILEELEVMYNDVHESREDLEYMIDGLVIELLDDDLREELGYGLVKPNFSIALKFPYMEKETTLLDIEYDVSPNGTGRITPMAVYEPVYFNGAKQSRTSLANYRRFKELSPLGKGSKILVQYRNDVLSYVEKLDVPENNDVKPFEFIKQCPVCGGKVEPNKKETYAFCMNDDCSSKIPGRIYAYISALDIKGIGTESILKLYNANILNSIKDLYTVRMSRIASVDGFAITSATNFKEAITRCNPEDYRIIAGLSIENIGIEKSKILVNEFSLNDLANLELINSKEFKSKVMNLEGYSTILTNKLIDGLNKHSELIKFLIDHVNIKYSVKVAKPTNQLKFVITGDTSVFRNREELIGYIEMHGHKVIGSVSKNTNYLVTNDTESGTVKNLKARELQAKGVNIRIITDAEVKDIIANNK